MRSKNIGGGTSTSRNLLGGLESFRDIWWLGTIHVPAKNMEFLNINGNTAVTKGLYPSMFDLYALLVQPSRLSSGTGNIVHVYQAEDQQALHGNHSPPLLARTSTKKRANLVDMTIHLSANTDPWAFSKQCVAVPIYLLERYDGNRHPPLQEGNAVYYVVFHRYVPQSKNHVQRCKHCINTNRTSTCHPSSNCSRTSPFYLASYHRSSQLPPEAPIKTGHSNSSSKKRTCPTHPINSN